MSLDVPCGWRCRAHRAHSSETSFDKPASRRDAMSNIFLRCIYVPVARSKHVSIHTFMVHRGGPAVCSLGALGGDRKSTRLNSSHLVISYAVFCLKKKKKP